MTLQHTTTLNNEQQDAGNEPTRPGDGAKASRIGPRTWPQRPKSLASMKTL